MTTKTMTIMTVITVILIAVAVWIFQYQDPASPPTAPRVFPELMATINDVSEIHVSAQSGTISIVRDGRNSWRVKEKSHYPADMGKIRGALLGFAELHILETKTKKPEFYEKLGVQDVEAEGSSSTGVTLKDAAGNIMADVIVGNDRPAKGKTGYKELFIRKPENPQTWLAVGRLSIENQPGEWLDKDFLQIEQQRVRRLRILHPDETRLVLEKAGPADTDYQVVNLPEGQEISSQFTVNNIVSTITSLSLDDVKPDSEISFADQAVATAIFETFDGLEGTVKWLRKDEKHYVTVSAAFDADLIQQPESEEQAEPEQPANAGVDDGTEPAVQDNEQEEPDKAEPTGLKSEAEVKAEIEALNNKVVGWVYIVPQFRAEAVLKKPEDLIKQPAEP